MLDKELLNNVNTLIEKILFNQAMWKNKTSGLQNFPKGIRDLQDQYNQYKRNSGIFSSEATFLVSHLKKIGEIASKNANRKSKNRDKTTEEIYQILKELENLGIDDSSGTNILNQCNKSLQNVLINESKSVVNAFTQLNFFSGSASSSNKAILFQALDIQPQRNQIYFYFTDMEPNQIFEHGVESPGKKLALNEGQIDLERVYNNETLYLLANKSLPNQLPKENFVYIVNSNVVVDPGSFSNGIKIQGALLIPNGILRNEIVGCAVIENGKIKEIIKNPHYHERLDPNVGFTFRGESRNNETHQLTERGFDCQGKVSDNIRKYVDERYPIIYFSTALEPDSCKKFPEELKEGETRYGYVLIKDPRMILTKDVYPESQHGATDTEALFPVFKPGEEVLGYYTLNNDQFLTFTLNPKHNIDIPEKMPTEEVLKKFNLPHEGVQIVEEAKSSIGLKHTHE